MIYLAFLLALVVAPETGARTETVAAFQARVRTVNPDPAPTVFVDNTLGANCLTTYNAVTRACGTGSAEAYNTLQGAQNVADPGDAVAIRGGTFNLAAQADVDFNRSGTSGNPIRYFNYGNESVLLKGPYDVDTDGDGIRDWDENDGMGEAVGPSDPGDRATVLNITADYLDISGLRISWVYECGTLDGAHFVTLHEIVCHDNWLYDLIIEGDSSDNVIKYFAAYRNRHGTPIYFVPAVAADLQERNVVAFSVAYNNGRQLPDNAIVLPFGSDSAGGGNSDGFVHSRNCVEVADPGDPPVCRDGVWQQVISWKNTDDCYDTQTYNWFYINTMSYACGPRGLKGYKNFLAATGMRLAGNIAVGGGVIDRPYEMRIADTDATATDSFILHNLGTGGTSQGMSTNAAAGEGDHCFVRNNLLWANTTEYLYDTCTQSNNYTGDVSGTPSLGNAAYDPATDAAVAEVCVLNAPHAVSVRSCWQTFNDAFYNAYKPAPASAVIDAGVVVAGYHCALADDNGQSPSSACRHWMGAAPDQGPYEFGITGNPDKSQCVLVGNC